MPYKTAPQAPFLSSDFLYTGKLQNGLEPVRCVGMFDKNKKINLPRMHHKFIVFCREEKSLLLDDFESEEICSLEPYAVWTGSYNFTKNSNFSFENAIYMEEKIVAEKYFAEWGQIATLSEILDWKQEYINPEALFE